MSCVIPYLVLAIAAHILIIVGVDTMIKDGWYTHPTIERVFSRYLKYSLISFLFAPVIMFIVMCVFPVLTVYGLCIEAHRHLKDIWERYVK